MSVKTLFYLLPFLSLVDIADAQERTAAGSLQMQASWSALQSIADQANKNAQSAHIRLNRIDLCARKGMFYAPEQPGAEEGCLKGFVVTGGGQCLTPEAGPRNGSAWTIRNAWGEATGCENGVPRCGGSKVLHIGYSSDRMGENEVANFCKYSGGNECHTQSFLCTRGM
ncbi:hypothetical protein [Agrobacterium tumefaciens]|uniref:hypothetical protein n=1 Tax=Agrobacterium tumefaciens TaxID=358 RepID=UPI001572A7AC|nr:hypothetical protein [Agrobacterium tumefaciens]NTB05787.1 hypothetical protein [Agrobacterium tumefaciens]